LATIIDIATRRVIGWATAGRCAPNWLAERG
jgi:hypothetical protein